MSVAKAVGIETEYGILILGAPDPNPFRASQVVLDAYPTVGGPAIPMGLYTDMQTGSAGQSGRGYGGQTPAEMQDDPIEVQPVDDYATTEVYGVETATYGTGSLMLANGARFYIDHAHPEYCTPEALSPRLIVAADKAGERIVERCMNAANANGSLPPGQQILIYKNNSDQKGNSYGCHENYLLSAELYEDLLRRRSHLIYRYLLPFLITRIIFTGAGKVGYENKTAPATYQLAQRADFFEMLMGLQTTYRRPLFNTRDEAHSDQLAFRRLHVILGDANMAEFSTYLKVGTTQIVLQMLEDGAIKTDLTLADPLGAFKQVSRDLTFRQPLALEAGATMTAAAIQEVYLDLAEAYLNAQGGSDEQWAVWHAWAEVIDTLQSADWQPLARKLDWAIKRQVLDRYLLSQQVTWEDVERWQPVIEWAVSTGQRQSAAEAMARTLGLPVTDYLRQREVYFTLRRLDLEYHDVHSTGPQAGLFYRLQAGQHVERVIDDALIAHHIQQPPPDTRAWLRGKIVERFAPHIVSADWSVIRLRYAGVATALVYQLEFPDPLYGTEHDLAGIWERFTTPEQMFNYFRDGRLEP